MTEIWQYDIYVTLAPDGRKVKITESALYPGRNVKLRVGYSDRESGHFVSYEDVILESTGTLSVLNEMGESQPWKFRSEFSAPNGRRLYVSHSQIVQLEIETASSITVRIDSVAALHGVFSDSPVQRVTCELENAEKGSVVFELQVPATVATPSIEHPQIAAEVAVPSLPHEEAQGSNPGVVPLRERWVLKGPHPLYPGLPGPTAEDYYNRYYAFIGESFKRPSKREVFNEEKVAEAERGYSKHPPKGTNPDNVYPLNTLIDVKTQTYKRAVGKVMGWKEQKTSPPTWAAQVLVLGEQCVHPLRMKDNTTTGSKDPYGNTLLAIKSDKLGKHPISRWNYITQWECKHPSAVEFARRFNEVRECDAKDVPWLNAPQIGLKAPREFNETLPLDTHVRIETKGATSEGKVVGYSNKNGQWQVNILVLDPINPWPLLVAPQLYTAEMAKRMLTRK